MNVTSGIRLLLATATAAFLQLARTRRCFLPLRLAVFGSPQHRLNPRVGPDVFQQRRQEGRLRGGVATTTTTSATGRRSASPACRPAAARVAPPRPAPTPSSAASSSSDHVGPPAVRGEDTETPHRRPSRGSTHAAGVRVRENHGAVVVKVRVGVLAVAHAHRQEARGVGAELQVRGRGDDPPVQHLARDGGRERKREI
jgi:hypothetical protein